MIFHPKCIKIPEVQFYFNCNDINQTQNPDLIYPLERISNMSKTPALKILGVYLDENLSFDYHFKIANSKITRSLYSLKNVKNVLSTSALKLLYYALIHPHFLYCLPVISCTSQKNINLLYKSQKWAVRIIGKAKYNAHSQPLFASLNILSFPDLIIQQKLHFMHAFVFNYMPNGFEGFFCRNNETQIHDYPMRNNDSFYIPRVKNDTLKRFPFYSIPSIWNDLPVHLKEISSKSLFRINLKLYLIQEYQNFICDRLFCYVCSNV